MLRKLIAIGLTVISLWFLVESLSSQWGELRNSTDISSLIVFSMLAVPVYVVTAVSGAIAWIFAFRSTGARLSFLSGLRIHLVSQVGKYIPGNVGHFVGRLGLLRFMGHQISNGAVSIVLEVLWLIGAAGVFSIYALFAGSLSIVEEAHDINDRLLLLVFLAALVAPNLMILIFNRMPEGVRRKFGFADKIRYPNESVMLGCYSLYFLNFLLNGLTLLIGFHWLFDASVDNAFLTVSLYALVWLLGFVLPGAPGGIGVREALIVLVFSGMYGSGAAAAMAVIMRIISVLGDLAAFGVGMLLSRWTRTAVGST